MKAIKLHYKEVIKIKPTAPFSFDKTFQKPDHFPSDDNFWKPGIKWQTILWETEPLGLKFIGNRNTKNPSIELSVFSKKRLTKQFVDSLVEEIKYRYNLGMELGDFYGRFRKDSVLRPVIKRMEGMKPGHQNSLYEYIIISIVLQNATVRRSVQMLKSLLENYGSLLDFDGKRLLCFWNPGDLKDANEEDLRKLKVGYRAKSILRIDEQFRKGLVNEFELRKQIISEQTNKLLGLYGVGPATVQYLLSDVFHHWNCLDHISPWEQKIYSKLFFDRNTDNPVSVKKLLGYFERYGKYKQLAVYYVWEDLFWRREKEHIEWLEKEIRL